MKLSTGKENATGYYHVTRHGHAFQINARRSRVQMAGRCCGERIISITSVLPTQTPVSRVSTCPLYLIQKNRHKLRAEFDSVGSAVNHRGD